MRDDAFTRTEFQHEKGYTMKKAHTGITAMLAGLVLLAGATASVAAESKEAQQPVGFEFIASSFLGTAGFDDSVVGARIQSDGTIVLAANLGPEIRKYFKPGSETRRGAERTGCLLFLSPDGKTVRSVVRMVDEVKDMAIDAGDRIYLAAGSEGVYVLSRTGDSVIWHKVFQDAQRVDAAPNGDFAAIADGEIHIVSASGKPLGTAKGSHYTKDVCIDGASKTVIFCGFRNANAFDGKRRNPVQICYIHGLDYEGQRKWTNYDWSTDRESERFLNKPTNNMADTRADRCTIGRDGNLYVTFQVAGGNHIFRYSPKDIMEKAAIIGGDKYHQFYNSRAEHKNFFARYEPATGNYLAGQQFCGRLGSGRANYVATKEGEINADEDGRVYIVGMSASGIPVNLNPGGDYMGGGFLLVMSPDLKTRLLCTRTSGGNGSPRAVDARTIDGNLRIVYAGAKMPEEMFVKNAVQAKAADSGKEKKAPRDGFFAILEKK